MKMPIIIIQLARINTQLFGLQIQCSLHGATTVSLVLKEKLVLMRINHHTLFLF